VKAVPRRAGVVLAVLLCCAGPAAAQQATAASADAASASDSARALERMRALQMRATREAEWLDSATAHLGALRRAGRHAEPLLLAFDGSLEMLRGKYALWPPSKLEHVREGRRRLDRAVALAPGHLEVRVLRLMSGFHLPFFIRDDEQVATDLDATARLLVAQAHRHPQEYVAELARFVLEEGSPDPDLRARLEALLP